ncbi:MAG TPA: RNA polymerase sigma factor [Ktedonobacterales bacterium]|nr:RNA polymerase sigma factor [Ktedonobacterales bacterium]
MSQLLHLHQNAQANTDADTPSPAQSALTAALGDERARLTRLCARLTGDADAAEDLAQEALLEAWRSFHKLRDADGLAPWLSAIARNVCLRWARSRGRELAHRATPLAPDADACDAPDDTGDLDAMRATTLAGAADEGDFTVELERQELATLLDRALALLPSETRLALVESAVYATPQAEIAARLGLSEGALRVRLSRGKVALRHALTTDLRDEADALGLRLPTGDGVTATDGWRATRIWCPLCGRHTLEYRIHPSCGAISFRCVGFCQTDGTIIGGVDGSLILPEAATLTSPKTILSRSLVKLGAHYTEGLGQGALWCANCGRRSPIHIHHPEHPQPSPYGSLEGIVSGFVSVCPHCGGPDSASLWHLMLDLPQAQRFWRAHPRMRATPERPVEVDGLPAVVTSFESLGDHARLDVITARESLITLAVYETSEPA